jgi:hypothetical protein
MLLAGGAWFTQVLIVNKGITYGFAGAWLVGELAQEEMVKCRTEIAPTM